MWLYGHPSSSGVSRCFSKNPHSFGVAARQYLPPKAVMEKDIRDGTSLNMSSRHTIRSLIAFPTALAVSYASNLDILAGLFRNDSHSYRGIVLNAWFVAAAAAGALTLMQPAPGLKNTSRKANSKQRWHEQAGRAPMRGPMRLPHRQKWNNIRIRLQE